MPRPKRPFSGVEDIQIWPRKWMTDEVKTPLGSRQRIRWEASQHWRYRTLNGQFDPLTYLVVLDQIANIDPDIELRAVKLTEWLNQHSEALIFDVVTVGKVISDLHDAFEDVLGKRNGLLERSRDWKGTFYRIHRNETTAKTYQAAREDLMRLTALEMEARNAGQRPEHLASPLIECPSLRGAWNDPAAE